MRNFVKIGRDIVIGTGFSARHWTGQVVFGRNAVYACPNTTTISLRGGEDSTAHVAGAAFGIIGLIFAAVLGKKAGGPAKWKDAITNLRDLPREVTSCVDWPVNRTVGPVIQLNRSDITSVKQKGARILITCWDETFSFGLKWFGRADALRLLHELGWKFQY